MILLFSCRPTAGTCDYLRVIHSIQLPDALPVPGVWPSGCGSSDSTADHDTQSLYFKDSKFIIDHAGDAITVPCDETAPPLAFCADSSDTTILVKAVMKAI